ncbi:MAG: TlpA family protein disulfide reductase [Acidobacteria bacterium]|nr:TlpA family protein disulfide reductase [Acidobacteriota bacterium]
MRFFPLAAIIFIAVITACRPAAAPVGVGERPVSVNGVQMKDAPRQPLKPITELSWTRFDGTVQKVKDFQGKVLLLDFWATYCPPCIEEIPHLMELERTYGPENLIIIGLHVGGEEDRPKVPEFVDNLKITYPLGTPEDELTRFVFGNETAIPQTAVFDREGRFVKKIIGFDDDIQKELDTLIEETVKKQ